MFRSRDWLARFSFSFIIIALVLTWEGYKGLQRVPPTATWRLILYMVGAAAGFALGFLGVRQRHHPKD